MIFQRSLFFLVSDQSTYLLISNRTDDMYLTLGGFQCFKVKQNASCQNRGMRAINYLRGLTSPNL
jgi:hypothetical protein